MCSNLLKSISGGVVAILLCANPLSPASAASSGNEAPTWLKQPLSLQDCLNIALENNSEILKSKEDLKATHGVSVQTRAIVIPKAQINGDFNVVDRDSIDRFPQSAPIPIDYPNKSWSMQVRLVQSIFEGGKIISSLKTAKLLKEQAYLNHRTVVADTMLNVRTAYADTLLAQQQIKVQEASVELLRRELEDTNRRFEAGTVPRFNVLRAEVEVANARPGLIRAKNTLRIAKHNLANLLGYHVPETVLEDIPMSLTGELTAEDFDVDMSEAIAEALERRTELAALEKAVELGEQKIVTARAGYLPSIQVFSGYGTQSSRYYTDLTEEVHGWFAGAQLSWNIFDGLLTKGKVDEAKANYRKAKVSLDDIMRKIELEVRTAYSNFREAQEVLESQKKVQEQAEEALRLAKVRNEAGTGTQLDVLDAQTSLTQARTTQIQALRDYTVARAKLERAIGQTLVQSGMDN